MALVVIGLHLRGWDIVHHVPDSQSYIQTGFMAPAAMLASVRTVGYPLFLRVVAAISPQLGILPLVHLAIHFLAVLLFYWSLRRFGATAWQAFAAATGVLWTVFHDPQIHDVASDSLARSMAVVTVACLLAVAATPRRLGPWIALTLSLAYTYHIRPAYLFLIPLIPCLGFLFLAIHAAWHQERFRWKRPVAVLAAMPSSPSWPFACCGLVVVGHFGLVSFGGLNIAGLTVELLDRPLIESHVPKDLQAAALEMLDARREIHRRHGWADAFRDGRINLPQLRENFDLDIYEVAAPPIMRRQTEAGAGDLLSLAVNRDLSRLSWSVLAARKAVYLRFVVDNFRLGLRDIPATNLTLPPLAMLAVFLWAARNLVWPGRSWPTGSQDDRPRCFTMQLAILLGVSFLLVGVLLLSVSHMTAGRYLISAALFLPSILVLWILQEVQQIAAALQATYRPSDGQGPETGQNPSSR